MADVKISELATSASSIGGYLPIVIGGVTKKVLVASVFDYISTGDGNGGQSPAPKPRSYVASGNTFLPGTSDEWPYSTTPNVSGAVYTVTGFDSSGTFRGHTSGVAANYDVTGFGGNWTTVTKMIAYRTA